MVIPISASLAPLETWTREQALEKARFLDKPAPHPPGLSDSGGQTHATDKNQRGLDQLPHAIKTHVAIFSVG